MKVDRYLLELIGDLQDYGCDITSGKKKVSNKTLAEHLTFHGVGVLPSVPGGREDDVNIAEMSYKNGQSAERARIADILTRMAENTKGVQASALRDAVEAVVT